MDDVKYRELAGCDRILEQCKVVNDATMGKPWTNRHGLCPPQTEPWRRGSVSETNRTVGCGTVRFVPRTEPHGSRFEPWSTLAMFRKFVDFFFAEYRSPFPVMLR